MTTNAFVQDVFVSCSAVCECHSSEFKKKTKIYFFKCMKCGCSIIVKPKGRV